MRGTKWTPGPWNTGGIFNPGTPEERQNVWGPRASPEDQSGPIVAEYLTIGNARLVQAAPELYEALEAAQEELRLLRMKDTRTVYDPTLRARISVVLAKARGEV